METRYRPVRKPMLGISIVTWNTQSMFKGILKARSNGFDFCLHECRAKVKQKLNEVLKQFRRDPTFLRTKEKFSF